MSEERYWYQDGWVVIGLIVGAGFAALLVRGCIERDRENSKPRVVPQVTGKLNQPIFGSPSLTITVWHQHTGTLRNGMLQVTLNEDPAKSEDRWQRQQHSFEAWEPNKDHAVTFTFPLQEYQPHKEIHLGFLLVGRDIKPFILGVEWLGQGWKSNQVQKPAEK